MTTENVPHKMPICPFCMVVMQVVNYQGYYDTFPYWCCACDESVLTARAVGTYRGSYG